MEQTISANQPEHDPDAVLREVSAGDTGWRGDGADPFRDSSKRREADQP